MDEVKLESIQKYMNTAEKQFLKVKSCAEVLDQSWQNTSQSEFCRVFLQKTCQPDEGVLHVPEHHVCQSEDEELW